ncbi:MAG: ferrous iron transporter B, partial [Clostridia bacterium]|nr:ferrous iron transporter B [Clostridia bacterium]
SILHIKMTTWFFSKRYIQDEDTTGLIMELPPYHKPNWKTIFSYTWNKMKHVFKKALAVITLVAVVVWILSYSSNGVLEDSVIYSVGKFLEPVGRIAGLDWKLIIAFIFSMMGKEAALGVIAMLFGVGSGVNSVSGMMVSGALQYDVASLSTAIKSSISPASALAFVYAFYFNVKCMAAMASVKAETHSVKWTIRITLYYVITALIIGAIAYRIGLLIF